MSDTYRTDVVKPFCPCDTGLPQDCKPETWQGAHSQRPCLNCGKETYQHHGWTRGCYGLVADSSTELEGPE
jgi:hypothetical protein